MAVDRRCDVTGARIDGPDAGHAAIHAHTNDGLPGAGADVRGTGGERRGAGLVFRVELVGWPGTERPNLHPHAVRRLLGEATLLEAPAEAEDQPATVPLRTRRTS